MLNSRFCIELGTKARNNILQKLRKIGNLTFVNFIYGGTNSICYTPHCVAKNHVPTSKLLQHDLG